MEKSTQIKIIGGLLALWGIVRLATLGMVLASPTGVGSFLVAADLVTGLILLSGSAGLFLGKQDGLYLGLFGILLVLGVNIYNFAAGSGGNLATIPIVAVVGYFLYDSREALR